MRRELTAPLAASVLALVVSFFLPGMSFAHPPYINLNKTISTTGDCTGAQVSDPLHVNAGTALTYCFGVSNQTYRTITVTAIVDDVLDGVFSGTQQIAYPGTYTFTVPVIASASVTNTAVVSATRASDPTTFTDTDSAVLTVCGDGELDPGEQCDDGNNLNTDGCDENCQLEPGAVKCPDTPLICDDGDGVDPATEDGVDGDMDGNDDGIPDSLQPTVTSLLSATGNGYLTLITESGNRGSACRNTMVETVAEGDLAAKDPDHDYPFGFIKFVLPPVCTKANLTVLYHGAGNMPATTLYRKYGPTPPTFGSSIYYTLPNVVFDSVMVNGRNTGRAQFMLRDAQLGDDEGPATNDQIVDQGGPTFIGGAAPAMSPWGLAAMSLALMAVAWFGFRRLRASSM